MNYTQRKKELDQEEQADKEIEDNLKYQEVMNELGVRVI